MLPSFVCEVTLGYMLAYRNCKCAEQLKFKITICGSYNMGKPDIIYEDNDIIVCYKPAGIATQTRRIGQQDMESFIRNYRAAKNEPPYVGIVHRLDQPVEGVMVFAKYQKAAASLSRQIRISLIWHNISQKTVKKCGYVMCLCLESPRMRDI